MKCFHCNTENRSSNLTCINCGFYLNIQKPVDESTPTSAPIPTTQCYIPVAVESGELPVEDGETGFSDFVFLIHEGGNCTGYYDFNLKQWMAHIRSNPIRVTPTHWLKPSTTPVVQGYSEDFIEALQEVIRISDRKHPAWEKVRQFLSSLNKQY